MKLKINLIFIKNGPISGMSHKIDIMNMYFLYTNSFSIYKILTKHKENNVWLRSTGLLKKKYTL
jgi:hypothetical protein